MDYAAEINAARERIAPFIHRTPVLTSLAINEIAACSIFFKCENFQKMGAFKMRGAANALMSLSKEEKAKGVVTHSSGNFAQAVALSAKLNNVRAFIVMPSNAPEVKKLAVKGYGGTVIECEPTIQARERTAEAIRLREGATFLHPYNQDEVVFGNASAAAELIEEVGSLDFLLAPVGGGGLISGAAIAANQLLPACLVVGAEPFEVDDAYRSLKAGSIQYNETTNTIADGLRTNLGDITFGYIQKYVDSIIRVDEEEIVAAMRLIWERMKIIVEPSCATPLAAILREKARFEGKEVGIIITGGNVDLSKLPF